MNKLVLIFFIILFALGSECVGTEGVLWQKIDDNNYINYEDVIGTNDIYGFIFILKSFNKGQYEPVNGKNISYTMSQYTIDCLRQTYKIGVMDSYGSDGNFINGDYNRYAGFQPIVSGTAVSEVFKYLCKP